MKRTITLFSVVLMAASAQSLPLHADDLFSEVTIGSVFTTHSEQSRNDLGRTPTGRRLSGIGSLRRLLAEAQFVPSDLEKGKATVEYESQLAESGKIRLTLEITDDRQQIVVAAALIPIAADKKGSSELKELLKTRQDTSTIHYGVSSGWLQARWRIPNEHVSASWLKEKFRELLATVQKDRAQWSTLRNPLNQVVDRAQDADERIKLDLEGTWRAQANGVRYGFRFSGTSFRLGIVTDGTLARSAGTWKLAGDQLVLSGNGRTLSATMKTVATDRLELQFGSQRTLDFQRDP